MSECKCGSTGCVKCLNREVIELERQLAEAKALIKDEDLIDKVMKHRGKCNATGHDDRWCSVCENMQDGMDHMQQYIERRIEVEDG